MPSQQRLTGCGWSLVLVIGLAPAAAGELAIRLDPQAADGKSAAVPGARFILSGLPSDLSEKLRSLALAAESWQQFYAVSPVIGGKPSSSAMLGDYEVISEGIAFTPRYPLRPGTVYHASFDPAAHPLLKSAGLPPLSRDFAVPSRAPAPPTRLTQIYPSTDVMPENLLKFYLHFSAPMSRGEAYRRIRLLDEGGKAVVDPFLELAEELWSPDGTRFTLYFDPGRIKRGLKPREQFGPALSEGHQYTLVVDQQWLDGNDQPLAAATRKRFRVVAPDDVQPRPDRWRIEPPPAGTREPLTVTFEEPLDAAMLQRVVEVRDARQQRVAGTIRLRDQERSWQLQPIDAWREGPHFLVVATTLEDLAGNSIGRPFEVDVFRPANPLLDREVVELSFRIGPRSP